MSSFVFNRALKDMLSGSLDLDTDVVKALLVNATYTASRDDDVIDAGTSSDAQSGEIVATGYAGGFAGAGRKTCTVTVTEDDANDRVKVVIGDLTWTALGGAANDTVKAIVLVKEITDDTLSRLIAYLELASPTTTNGSDFVVDMDAANGNLRFTT